MEKISLTDEAETNRIKALKKYEILDTPPDGIFDRLVALASRVLDVPIVIVSLVDTDRIWFKSTYGLNVQQIDREMGLCASAILGKDIYLVEDAIKDPRTLTNSLVAGSFGLRFYAAVPLQTTDGYNLGTFCIIDKKPRQLSDEQQSSMYDFAAMVMDQMELRLSARKVNFQQNHLLNTAMHNLRNPLSTISMRAQLLKEFMDDRETVEESCEKIVETVTRVNKMIQDLLDSASLQEGKIVLNIRRVNLTEVVNKIFFSNKTLADHKGQRLVFKASGNPAVMGDENRLAEIADNLINNAIKFSPIGTDITVSIESITDHVILKVIDQGPGFTDDDRKLLFKRFSRLSAKPTGGEPSTGLGLSIVKTLVEAHEGMISVECDGQNRGSAFVVKLPALVSGKN
ncbi:MAG: GAF domain-containing sensor histidine kinase [Bacteroidota bacterium]|nr:GAF domain-containing sensor histidine kinase [Bacteroidota bacterium]